MSYSNLYNSKITSIPKNIKNNLFPGVDLSLTTYSQREKVKSMFDCFTTFQWRGYNSFDSFGAFIINDKDSEGIKFYNPNSFTNEYTKAQFQQDGGTFKGISFDIKQISFKIGVYWTTIETYRRMLHWLDPKVISYLTFDYDSKYSYLVKLDKIGDSNRRVIGWEEKKPVYYTELSLTFDIQGPICARSNVSLAIESNYVNNNWIINFANNDPDTDWTELSTPIEFEKDMLLSNNKRERKITLQAKFVSDIDYSVEIVDLFMVELQNLTYNVPNQNLSEDKLRLTFRYDSETGLLFINNHLASLLYTTTTGESMIKSLIVNKFYLPGVLDYPELKKSNFSFIFTDDGESTELSNITYPLLTTYSRVSIA